MNDRIMRILRVAPWIYPDSKGGGDYHVHAMSRDQAAMGHDVTVLTTRSDSSLPRVEETHGYTVYRVSPGVELLGNEISPGMARFLWHVDADDYDVIHAHSHYYFSSNLAALVLLGGVTNVPRVTELQQVAIEAQERIGEITDASEERFSNLMDSDGELESLFCGSDGRVDAAVAADPRPRDAALAFVSDRSSSPSPRRSSGADRWCSMNGAASLVGRLRPSGDLLAVRVVHGQTRLEGFVHLLVVDMPVLVCQHVSKADRGDERLSRLFVDDSLAIKHSNRTFGRRPVESELA